MAITPGRSRMVRQNLDTKDAAEERQARRKDAIASAFKATTGDAGKAEGDRAKRAVEKGNV